MERLDWLAKTPQPAPQVIGADELSIKKGHTYRIEVNDLERGRPIWVRGAGTDRSRSGSVLSCSGAAEDRPHSLGGDGYVEGLQQLGAGPCAAGPDSARQIPHPASSGSRHGSAPSRQIRPPAPHGRDFFSPLDRIALADESLDHPAIIELQRSYSQRRRDPHHKATKVF